MVDKIFEINISKKGYPDKNLSKDDKNYGGLLRNQNSPTLDFSNLPVTQTKSRFPFLVKHHFFCINLFIYLLHFFPRFYQIPQFLEPIFVCLAWRLEKLRFHSKLLCRRFFILKCVICRFSISAKLSRKVQESSFGSKTVSKPKLYLIVQVIY